jgi:transketolase
MVAPALGAAEILAQSNIMAEVVSFHTIKPMDTEYLNSASARFPLVVTVEEHGLIGGFGSAVSEWRSDTNQVFQHLRFGSSDEFLHEVGSQEYARKKFGLTSENIAERIKAVVSKSSNK